MTPEDVRRLIEPELTALRTRGVTGLYVFGSIANGTAQPDSDVDLMVDYDPTSGFNLFDLSGLHLALSRRLRANVDLITKDSIHRRIRDRVLKEAVRIF